MRGEFNLFLYNLRVKHGFGMFRWLGEMEEGLKMRTMVPGLERWLWE